MNWKEISTIVALIIAVFGALFKYFSWRKDIPKLKLKVLSAFPIYPNGRMPDFSDYLVSIDIVNISRRPMKVVSAGFYDALGRRIQLFEPNGIPKLLADGDNHSIWNTKWQELENIGVVFPIRAWVRDATGKEFRSKKFGRRK